MQNNVLGQCLMHVARRKYTDSRTCLTGEEYRRVSKMHYSLKATMGDDLIDASTDFVSLIRYLNCSPLTDPLSGRYFLRSVPPIKDLHPFEHQLTEPS